MTRRFRTGWLSVTLILTLVLGLTACSGEGFTASGTQTQSSQTMDGGTHTVHLDRATAPPPRASNSRTPKA